MKRRLIDLLHVNEFQEFNYLNSLENSIEANKRILLRRFGSLLERLDDHFKPSLFEGLEKERLNKMVKHLLQRIKDKHYPVIGIETARLESFRLWVEIKVTEERKAVYAAQDELDLMQDFHMQYEEASLEAQAEVDARTQTSWAVELGNEWLSADADFAMWKAKRTVELRKIIGKQTFQKYILADVKERNERSIQ